MTYRNRLKENNRLAYEEALLSKQQGFSRAFYWVGELLQSWKIGHDARRNNTLVCRSC